MLKETDNKKSKRKKCSNPECEGFVHKDNRFLCLSCYKNKSDESHNRSLWDVQRSFGARV